ncbi:ABC transporter substrate-binding protein [Paenibacillus sp. WQ 127069]|uniref:ABC transporter substrate-binding protein n=1 Tax=Paenibacillus baimaensis TaxID=2982185 RepID=A0ABT2UI25_9BACL|nr:ABC transporter substrate-binding protein [Paenibacillus sp. WQ 127069]MCU6794297.1 ABC transporter substrate-binding protein [Paenibacillus sp. WQ 127069]
MKTHRKLTIITLLLSALLVTSACSKTDSAATGTASTGGKDTKEVATVSEVRYPLSLTFASLDPHLVPTGGVANIDRHIYEQLVAFNTKYEAIPVLAESVDISNDGKTYTFPLRKGVKFHNGKEMKAEDVVASLNRWKEITARAKTSIGASNFEAKDEYTVVLNLSQPSNDIPSQLASYLQFAAIMPKEVIAGADAKGVKEFIGTGPYKFVEYKQDQYVHVAKFDDYKSVDKPADGVTGKKEAFIKDIYFDLVPDTSTMFSSFLAGNYNFADITVDNLNQVKSLPDVEVQKVLSSDYNVVFNKKAPITSNLKFREAIAAALDVEKILVGSTSDPNLIQLNPSLINKDSTDWYSEAGKEKYNQKNPEKAKQLLKEAGYNGEELKLLTTRDSGGVFYNPTVLVKDQLEKIGVKSKFEVYDFTTMISKRSDPSTWDIYVGSFALQSSPSQLLYLGKTYGWPEDEKLQNLVKATTTALTKEDKRKAADALQAYEYEYLAAIKIGDFATYKAVRKNVTGYNYFEGPILWNTKVLK